MKQGRLYFLGEAIKNIGYAFGIVTLVRLGRKMRDKALTPPQRAAKMFYGGNNDAV